ncbi:Jasmonoyl--L-amino acid synthetase jar4 [Asimina triloba]
MLVKTTTAAAFDSERVIEEFEAATKDAERVQIETLRKILEENADAEYLQKLGLGARTDLESFKSLVPLATHKDLEPYIQRIADGDDSAVLTAKPITTISLSSGTTQGKPKFVPFNEELLMSTMQIFRTSFAFRNREFPIENGKALQFIYGSKQFKTKGGLAAGTATTNIYRSEQFKSTMKDIQSPCCSPDEVIFGPDFQQSLYCHLLCGLIYWEEVQFVSSTFAHSIIRAFRTFEQVWEELCADIREGVLSSGITVPSIRSAVSKILKPNPELADSIHAKCSGLSNWYGVVPALWPNAKYVYGIMTGSMEPYLKKLRHYSGNLPLVSSDYGSSEGWVGANVNARSPPELVTYAVLPDIGYFEFIPVRETFEQQGFEKTPSTIIYMESEPVGLTEVKIGEEYEIVVTNFAGMNSIWALSPSSCILLTFKSALDCPSLFIYSLLAMQLQREFPFLCSFYLTLDVWLSSRLSTVTPLSSLKHADVIGLYRYRLGDVVKVMGFHNSTPELQFVCRRSLLLTINIDKNTEKDLQLAVEAATKVLAEEKVEVLDFTSHVDASAEPGRYVIFWELSEEASEAILGDCCNCLDRSFVDAGYVSSRKVNAIGALELRIVRRGTFQKILDHYLGLGAAVSQFKTPRCISASNSHVLHILCSNVVRSYFSTAFSS